MEQLQYLKYNNYFNRVHKPIYTTPTEYWDVTGVISEQRVLLKQNFVPGDGVNTTHVLGKGEDINDYDYLVVYTDREVPTVVSRWFIIKSDRLRGGQWSLTLKRDTISDYYDNLLTAPAIIERAMCDADNPLIFNKEQFTYNQIQKEEPILLQDETKVQWAVAYIPTNTEQTTVTADNNVIIFNDFPLTQGTYKVPNENDIQIGISYRDRPEGTYNTYTTILKQSFPKLELGNLRLTDTSLRLTSPDNVNSANFDLYSMYTENSKEDFQTKAETYLKDHMPGYTTNAILKDALNYKEKVISVSGQLYRVNIKETGSGTDEGVLVSDTNSILWSKLSTTITASGIFDSSYNTINNKTCFLNCRYKTYTITYTPVSSTSDITYVIPASRKHNDSGLYDIIAFPIGSLDVYNNGSVVVTTKENIQRLASLELGRAISGSIYDIQLLPYCPVRKYIDSATGRFDITGATADVDYTFIINSDDPDYEVGILFYVDECNSTFDIQQKLDIEYKEANSGTTKEITHPDPPQVNYEYNIKPTAEITIADTFPNIDNDYYLYWHGSSPKTIECYTIDTRDYSITDRFYGSGIKLNISHTTNQDVHKATLDSIEITDLDGEVGRNLEITPEGYIPYPYRICVKFVTDKLLDADTPLAVDLPHDVWKSLFGTPVYLIEDANMSVKVDSECSFERLVSPNYQGSFEFCVAKNGGVDYFNVDMTLKPYNPYIHLNPNFKNMYGGDYNEAKGLICNGDFSFGQLTDAFRSYELQNKNYEAIFNRQIQSMDIEHKLQKTEAIASMIAGGAQGGTTLGAGAALLGASGPGAIAAGVGAGALSLGAGLADYNILKERQAEQKDLAIDMHEFQLGNIRALPYSLTKCPAFTYNNMKFPFIERYDATDTEKEILRKYLKLRSFNINAMGSIEEYIQDYPTFIKGQLIRLDSLHCPTNIANDLYNEINQGVYM